MILYGAKYKLNHKGLWNREKKNTDFLFLRKIIIAHNVCLSWFLIEVSTKSIMRLICQNLLVSSQSKGGKRKKKIPKIVIPIIELLHLCCQVLVYLMLLEAKL